MARNDLHGRDVALTHEPKRTTCERTSWRGCTAAHTRMDRSMADLQRLEFAMIGFAVVIVLGGVLLGFIGAAIQRR